MRLYAPLFATLLAACGDPTSSGDTPDASGDRPVGTVGHGFEVTRAEECAPGLVACRQRSNPRDPTTARGGLICTRPDTDFHCGACYTLCPSMMCTRGDAGAYACAP